MTWYSADRQAPLRYLTSNQKKGNAPGLVTLELSR